jgi:acyl carrier protein
LPSASPIDQDGDAETAAPATETERTIATLWRELLGVRRIRSTDDFFELGGHSLVAIKCVSRLRESFGVDVALRHLFEHPTVVGLAAIVDGLVLGARPRAAAAEPGARVEITV